MRTTPITAEHVSALKRFLLSSPFASHPAPGSPDERAGRLAWEALHWLEAAARSGTTEQGELETVMCRFCLSAPADTGPFCSPCVSVITQI